MEESECIYGSGWRNQAQERRDEEMENFGRGKSALPQ